MEIPIQNLYYLLLYAWQKRDLAGMVRVEAKDATSLLDLFAKVLVAGTGQLLKRGLDRGYVPCDETLRGIRGAIDFGTTLKRNLLRNALLACRFDDLSRNVLHNRILKATIRRLIENPTVANELRQELADLHRRLVEVEDIALTKNLFGRVQLHRNNRFYSFLMDVCELIFDYHMITETEGKITFRAYVENKLSSLFEDFVRNFYKIELEGRYPGFQVKGAEEIAWMVGGYQGNGQTLLPKMKTDISIRTPAGYTIIDTKFYGEALAMRFDAKVRSNHLYQLFAYLQNIAGKGEEYRNASGVLLYPTVTEELDAGFQIHGHWIFLRTVNLGADWRLIEKQLLTLMLDIGNGRQASGTIAA